MKLFAALALAFALGAVSHGLIETKAFAAHKGAPFIPEVDDRFNALEVKSGPAASVPAVATANASDLATAIALANQLKTSLNAALAALKAQGMMSNP